MNLELEAATSALVLVDLQQGVLGMSLTPYPAPEVLAQALDLGWRFKAADALIVAVNVAFAADGVDRLRQPVDFSLPVPAGGLPPGWSELDPAVAALGGSGSPSGSGVPSMAPSSTCSSAGAASGRWWWPASPPTSASR